MPKPLDYRIGLAAEARSTGSLSVAESLCRSIIKHDPGAFRARCLLLAVLFGKWTTSIAANATNRPTEGDGSRDSAYTCALAFRRLGRHDRAASWARRAVDIEPSFAAGHGLLGACLVELGRFEEAEESLLAATRTEPLRAEHHVNLGLALRGSGHHGRALAELRRAAELASANWMFQAFLVAALIERGETKEARWIARRILAAEPRAVFARKLLAQALMADNLEAHAEVEARRAVDQDPLDADGAALLGTVLQTLGKGDEATSEFRRALDLDPRIGLPYFNLVSRAKASEADLSLVRRMEPLADDETLEIGSRSLICYGLGKVFEDLGRYQEAATRFEDANRLEYRRKFGDRRFVGAAHKAKFDAVKEIYDERVFDSPPDAGIPDECPIFVVGMMRSGTTLTEQILSRHPDVGAAGEQRFWPKNRLRATPHGSAGPDHEIIRGLAEEYVGLLRGIAPGKGRVVDKMPLNYLNVGLLTLALPKARIIHVRRHPIDTCLSIYTTQNQARLPWAHDKGNIAFNYRCYLDVMEHWRAVLPPTRFIEIRYEELVTDPEGAARQLLDACGLAWSDDCLTPELNPRAVTTPSLLQVRRPVYRSSVERWKRFEPWLGDLASLA